MSDLNSNSLDNVAGRQSLVGNRAGNPTGSLTRTQPALGSQRLDGATSNSFFSSLYGKPMTTPGQNTPGVGPFDGGRTGITTASPTMPPQTGVTTSGPAPTVTPPLQGTPNQPGDPQGTTGSGPNVISGPVKTGPGGGTFIQSGSGTGGFGGYNPNQPPAGYDADAWATDWSSNPPIDRRTGQPSRLASAHVLADGRTVGVPHDLSTMQPATWEALFADKKVNPIVGPTARQEWAAIEAAYRSGGPDAAALVMRGVPIGQASAAASGYSKMMSEPGRFENLRPDEVEAYRARGITIPETASYAAPAAPATTSPTGAFMPSSASSSQLDLYSIIQLLSQLLGGRI